MLSVISCGTAVFTVTQLHVFRDRLLVQLVQLFHQQCDPQGDHCVEETELTRSGSTHLFLTFMGPCIVNVFFKYNQQDASLYNIL